MTNDNIVGRFAWEFGDPSFERHFAECLIHGRSKTVNTLSKINGTVEHWRTTLLPAHGTEVISIGQEVMHPIDVQFTDEDLDILRRLADDSTIEDISAAIGQSKNTVSSKVKRLREKCDVKTNHGLVAWCIRNGAI